MKEFDTEERVETALRLIYEGYNCAQAVTMAYSDLFDIPTETARNMSISFGGGVGRMREVCGTVSGMALIAGFAHPVSDPSQKDAQKANLDAVRSMSGGFKEKYGTLVCRELLTSDAIKSELPPMPERLAQYYGKRQCARFVETAARNIAKMLHDTKQN